VIAEELKVAMGTVLSRIWAAIMNLEEHPGSNFKTLGARKQEIHDLDEMASDGSPLQFAATSSLYSDRQAEKSPSLDKSAAI
jgi:hypothetical protein